MKSLIVAEDDLEVGKFYAVLGFKDGEGHPVAGQAFEAVALKLPFLIGKIGGHNPMGGPNPALTIDTRAFNLMEVGPEYFTAQSGQAINLGAARQREQADAENF